MRACDSDEEADRHAGLRTRALPVADLGLEFDEDAPPADGLESLARVRREAAAVPDVMVADGAALLRRARESSLTTDDTNRGETCESDTETQSTEPNTALNRKRFAASAPVLAAAAAAAPAAAASNAEEGDGDRGASDAVMEDADSADATAEDPWYQPRKVDFWPGGRLKGPEFEGEERILEDLEETLTEERLHKMLAAVTSDRAG